MSSSVNVSGTGPPNVVLPGVDNSMQAALDAAIGSPERDRRDAVARVVAQHPRYLAAWAALGDVARDKVTWLIGSATTVDLMHFDRTVGREAVMFAGLLIQTMAFSTV
jgi:hypothetical protein